jgi:hypothetical protein
MTLLLVPTLITPTALLTHDPDSGNLYIVYKVDGNSVGKGTPILLQQVIDDGFTPIGTAV